MPSTEVYLVLPASVAWIAASLTLAGVSKSGSPAPSPMTLRPAALSWRALSVTAMVAEGFTRDSAADRNDIVISSDKGQSDRGKAVSAGATSRADTLASQAKRPNSLLFEPSPDLRPRSLRQAP